MGMVWVLIYCAYALGISFIYLYFIIRIHFFFRLFIGFWYGAKLIREENYNIGNVIIVS